MHPGIHSGVLLTSSENLDPSPKLPSDDRRPRFLSVQNIDAKHDLNTADTVEKKAVNQQHPETKQKIP